MSRHRRRRRGALACKWARSVAFAEATEGITRNLTSGDLGGDVEGGDRDLCEEVGVWERGGAKDTINAQNFKSNSVDITKKLFFFFSGTFR